MMDLHRSADSRLTSRTRVDLTGHGRWGGTLLEVLFAIFVVVVGLAGIASLLPLAARNANDSNAHNIAQALGQQWFNSFFSYHLHEPNAFENSQVGYNWLWFRDNAAPGFQIYNRNALPAASGSTLTSGATQRMWAHQAICLDPMFFSEPEVVQHIDSNLAEQGAYRLSVFPYFEDGYNPLTDPWQGSDPWPDQPRMVRATLGPGRSSPVSRKLVEDMFASADDVSMAADQTDRSLPPFRLFDPSVAKGLLSGQYSWMATLSPREPLPTEVRAVTNQTQSDLMARPPIPTRDAMLSVVVMNRRDRLFLTPNLALQPGTKEDKPQGERLVWVLPLSGNFTGGNGGRVRLVCDVNTDDVLHTGDWIMLGKHYAIDPVNTQRRYAYFRWYRIIGMSREPAVVNLTGPFGNTSTVWTRDVILEGPDFDMTSTLRVGGNTVQTPVTGTIVNGVVTVVERTIQIK